MKTVGLIVALIVLLGYCNVQNMNMGTKYLNDGDSYLQKHSWQHAVQEYDKAVAVLRQPLADAYNNRGYAYEHLNRYEDAAADFRRAVAVVPDSAMYNANLSHAYNNLKKPGAAIEAATRAIRLDGKWKDGYENRGDAYMMNEESGFAIMDYTQAIALAPDEERLYECRALCYEKTGDTEAAEEDRRRVKAIRGDKEAEKQNHKS